MEKTGDGEDMVAGRGAGADRAPGAGASIKDVSLAAGVSISTVSHVLNRTRYVSDGARERVQRAIAELDYRHNGLARSLRTRQSYAIGLIIPDVTNPYYPQIARGVQDAARRPGTGSSSATATAARRWRCSSWGPWRSAGWTG